MNIIHLTDGQRDCVKINHPLLDHAVKMSEGDLLQKMDECFSGSKQARDDLIMGHLYCVKNIVGRFLANWPETKRFEEDMISEGLAAVVSVVDDMRKDDTTDDFVKRIWGSIKDDIETFLNDSRSTFSASRRENYYSVSEGKEPDYNYAQSFQNDGIDQGVIDHDPIFVDFLDELEQFSETDREHFRHMIMQCMDQDHNISESDLSEEDKEAIEAVSKILGDV